MTIKPARGIRLPVTVPVGVIGAGACGLTAALAARDAGAEVLVLERDRVPRGSTALSSGFIPAAATRFQRDKGIEDSPALLTADIMAKNKGRSSPTVTARVAERAGPTLEWFADRHGVPFEVIEGFLYPGHSVLRMHATPRRTRADLMGYLLAAAETAGILTTWALMMEGGFQVNAEGRRFSNEQRGYSEQAVDVLRQTGGTAIEVFDARLDALGQDFEDYRNAVAAGAIRRADSIAELASLFGLPAPALAATLAETQAMAAGARADPFGRDFTKKPALAPPFYGVRVTGAPVPTPGGLEIDTHAPVPGRDRPPLPNLPPRAPA